MDEIDPERALQSRQALSTVTGAIKTMPERTRTIFVLFRLEHMKQREIADLLGVSVRTVEQHVTRATLIQIGRAHVCTPVPNPHLVCRLLLDKQNKPKSSNNTP